MANPPRNTTAGQAYNDLRNKARRDGRPTDELLVLYVLEEWLYRATLSPYRERFVLKGGLLLAALDARRPTRDGDLLAYLQADESDDVVSFADPVLGGEARTRHWRHHSREWR